MTLSCGAKSRSSWGAIGCSQAVHPLASLDLNKECQMLVVEFSQMTRCNKKYNTKPINDLKT